MILARRFLVTGTRRQPESRRRVRGFAAFLRTGAGAVDKDGEPGGSGGAGQAGAGRSRSRARTSGNRNATSICSRSSVIC